MKIAGLSSIPWWTKTKKHPKNLGFGLANVPDGVYLVEQESDHCFNLVRDNFSVYLIDSNLHIFKPLKGRQDAKVDDYDYMYPEKGEDNDALVFYRLGPLHPNWM